MVSFKPEFCDHHAQTEVPAEQLPSSEPSNSSEAIPTEEPVDQLPSTELSNSTWALPTEVPADPSSFEPSSNPDDVPTEVLTNPSPAPSNDVSHIEVLVNVSIPLTTINASEVLSEENSTNYTLPNIPEEVQDTTHKSFYNSIPFESLVVAAGVLVAGIAVMTGVSFWKQKMALRDQDSDSGPESARAMQFCNVLRGIISPPDDEKYSRYDVSTFSTTLSVKPTPISTPDMTPKLSFYMGARDFDVNNLDPALDLSLSTEEAIDAAWREKLVEIPLHDS